MQKLKEKENREQIGIGMRELNVYTLVENNPGISSGDIAKRLGIPNSTVKRILTDLVTARNLSVHGAGRGTRYSIAVKDLIKQDMGIVLTNETPIKEYTLQQASSFIRIKKIVLTPKFDWKHPNEWSTKLL
jgi:predicted transcriptional regulator